MPSPSPANKPFPRIVLLGAAVAVVASLTLAAMGTQDRSTAPAAFPGSTVTAERLLRFEDRPGGGVVVIDASVGRTVTLVEPGQGHFLRATLRGLVRERRQFEAGGGLVAPEQPFRVAAWSDGRVTLDDLATGRRVELVAFGPDNVAPFARLITAPFADQLAFGGPGAGR